MPLTIKARKDGPYAVDLSTGEFVFVHHEGNVIPLPQLRTGKTIITLCRCRASTRKPFCDATYSTIGFEVAQDAHQASDAKQEPGGPR
jgi:CDGSH-type Zn-finger protein